ncbi:MAG TPA: hydroxymethylbilane synthase [bacterium]|nr:hydroxymethylbilane synthase [bacterium]
MAKIIIGSRGSKLALWQAGWVRDALSKLRPDLEITLQVIKTEGDARHDLSPGAFGREGIFTAELDRALLDRRIDLAVHSLKDLPTRLGQGLALAAVTERESIRDVFIITSERAEQLGITKTTPAREALARLPHGFKVGTSSLRRVMQLKYLFPKLEFAPLRGNLDTRLKKVAEGRADAVVVAEAGLNRLGVGPRGHLFIQLTPDWYLPAAGQGALAIESRSDDPARAVAFLLEHAPTRAAVTAERTAMAALGAGCRVPAGFLATVDGERMSVSGVVGDPEGNKLIKADAEGKAAQAEALGKALSDDLLRQGAGEILKAVRG